MASVDIERFYWRLPIPLQNVACSAQGWRLKRRRYDVGFERLYERSIERESRTLPELAAYRTKALCAQFAAAARSTFWGEVFAQHAVSVESDDPWRELEKLPVIRKSMIQPTVSELTSDSIDARDVIMAHTSGTTGAGLVFPVTHSAEREQWAVWWRYRRHHGIDRNHLVCLFRRAVGRAGDTESATVLAHERFWTANDLQRVSSL